MSTGYPEFSIAMETDNLDIMSAEGMFPAIDSLLNQQKVSARDAKEFVLIEAGEAPQEALDKLTQRYPFIKIIHAPRDTTYYGNKLMSRDATTGKYIITTDSDCVYQPDWLHKLLDHIRSEPTADVVAGDVKMIVQSPYDLALAANFTFPPVTKRTTPFEHVNYLPNSTIFRRDVLEQHPIPLGLPLFRGNCFVHATRMRRAGVHIWKVPDAIVMHTVPEFGWPFVSRYLTMGHDGMLLQTWEAGGGGDDYLPEGKMKRLAIAARVTARRFRVVTRRLRILVNHTPKYTWYLPVTIPILGLAMAIYTFSALMTAVSPKTVERWVRKKTMPDNPVPDGKLA